MVYPKLLDGEVIALICLYIKEGATANHAAVRAGCSRSTFIRWMKKGNADFDAKIPSAEAELHSRVEQARAARAMVLVEHIEAIAALGKHWSAYSWILERQFKDEYSPSNDKLAELEEKVEALTKAVTNLIVGDQGDIEEEEKDNG